MTASDGETSEVDVRRATVVLAVALLVAAAGCAADQDETTGPRSSAAARPAAGVADAGATAGPGAGLLAPADSSQGPGELDWEPCEPPGVSLCAEVDVPRDHADPTGEQISVAVELVPAANRAERKGVIWWNPGGPGMPAISGTGGIATSVPQALRDHFDIAAFDPRGIGRSTPLDCGTEPIDDQVDLSPDEATEVQRALAVAREQAEACASASAELLPHLGTQSVARDLDLLRAAVGDERLNFIGMSYGTVIAQQYLALFPERAGAIVLDGVVDVSVGWEQRWTDMAQGRELAFQRFLAWCADDPACAFHSDGQPADAFTSLITGLESDPIELPDEVVDRASLEGELSQALYSGEQGWELIAHALALYRDRDVTCIADFACRVPSDLMGGPDPDQGGDGEEDDDLAAIDGEMDDDFEEAYADGVANRSYPFDAVTCVDWPLPHDEIEFEAATDRIAAAAPIFGRILSWAQAPCLYWQPEPAGLQIPAALEGRTPLVISTTHDPATPLKHATSVASRLGAPLITVDSARHVIFPSGEGCLDDLVVAYFVDGAVPSSTSCPMPPAR